MVVFFYSVFSVFGFTLCKLLFGIDFISNPDLINNLSSNPDSLNAAKFLQVFVPVGGLIIPAWLFPKALQLNPVSFLKIDTRFDIRYLVPSIVLIIVSIPVIAWLINVNENMHLPESMHDLEMKLKASEDMAAQLTNAFVKTNSFSGLLLNILVIALAPALCEEFLFRGTLQQFILICFKNKHVAVWSTAIIFSAVHMQFFGFFPRAALGIFLGYMFVYSKNIWIPAAAHFFNNLMTLLASYYKWNESSELMKDDYVFPFYVIALSILFSIALIVLMHTFEKKEQKTDGV